MPATNFTMKPLMAAATASSIVHLFHHSFRPGGGVERYGREFGEELVRQGRRVEFHARRIDERISRPEGLAVRQVRCAGFPRKLRDYYYHRAIARLGPSLAGTQFALTRVPATHGQICGGTHRGYLSKARKFTGPFDRLQIWMERRSYLFTRRMISHSHLCAGELEALYGVPPDRITTIHPPADVRHFTRATPGERREARHRLNLPEDRVVFAFPSSGHKRKGLLPLIRAMTPFAGKLCLAVTGRPPGSTESFVRHLGYVDDIADLYKAADFTAMASYYEPFGQVGVESILCGTPLLFERNMGCLEVVNPCAAITFDVWNPRTIEAGVNRALELAATGRHRIEDPMSLLSYDPSVESHVRRVMETIEPAT